MALMLTLTAFGGALNNSAPTSRWSQMSDKQQMQWRGAAGKFAHQWCDAARATNGGASCREGSLGPSEQSTTSFATEPCIFGVTLMPVVHGASASSDLSSPLISVAPFLPLGDRR